MHSPSHTPARDHDAPWSAEAKPAKRAKKKAAKKKSTAKTSAKKKSTKTSAKKKSSAKTPAKKKSAKRSTAKKSSAKKSASVRVIPLDTPPNELLARLFEPLSSAEREVILAALQHQLTTREPGETEPATVAELRAEVSALTHKLADLSEQLAAMKHTVDSLATSDTAAPLADEVLEDPFAWIRRDPSITRYQGQHVALHPTRGVVAHASQLDAMLAELRASDVSLDDIVLDYVADSPF